MSAKFTDLKGREFTCVITLSTMQELRDDLKVDIGNINDGKLFDQLSLDDELLVNVLGIVCKGSIAAHGIVDAKDMAEGLGGDTLDSANDAFWEAVADFTRPRKRKLLRELIEKSKEVEAAAVNRVSAELAEMDPATVANQAMENLKKQTSSSGAGS